MHQFKITNTSQEYIQKYEAPNRKLYNYNANILVYSNQKCLQSNLIPKRWVRLSHYTHIYTYIYFLNIPNHCERYIRNSITNHASVICMCFAHRLALKCFWWKEARVQKFVNPCRSQPHNYVVVNEFALRASECCPRVQTSSQVKMSSSNASRGESVRHCYQLGFHFRRDFRLYHRALHSGIITDNTQIFLWFFFL